MSSGNHNVDDRLVALIRAGDIEAFEKVFHSFADRLYYFAYRYLRNQCDAEELVQDVFVKLWENRKNLDEKLSFSGYLFTIARNTIFNQSRKKVNERAYFDYVKTFITSSSSKTEEDLIYADVKAIVDKVVEELPPQRKRIYKMSREKGLTYREIANEINLSERTVEAHLRLALKTLSKVLDDHFVLPLLLIVMASSI